MVDEKIVIILLLAWVVFGILLVVLSICLGMAIMHASDEKIGVIISYVGFIFGLFLIIGYVNSKPKAIDVYKGKTELRITYEGNTPVDSVVVFKRIKEYNKITGEDKKE